MTYSNYISVKHLALVFFLFCNTGFVCEFNYLFVLSAINYDKTFYTIK